MTLLIQSLTTVLSVLISYCISSADTDQRRVPKGFPRCIVTKEGFPSKSYRNCEDENSKEYKAFCYYSNRILSAINPHNSKYRQRRTTVPLSEMLTVQDEALALMMLANEYDVWVESYYGKEGEASNARPTKKVRKKYVNANSGNKMGLSMDGLAHFSRLEKQVDALRRDEKTGSIFENKLRNTFRSESNLGEVAPTNDENKLNGGVSEGEEKPKKLDYSNILGVSAIFEKLDKLRSKKVEEVRDITMESI